MSLSLGIYYSTFCPYSESQRAVRSQIITFLIIWRRLTAIRNMIISEDVINLIAEFIAMNDTTLSRSYDGIVDCLHCLHRDNAASQTDAGSIYAAEIARIHNTVYDDPYDTYSGVVEDVHGRLYCTLCIEVGNYTTSDDYELNRAATIIQEWWRNLYANAQDSEQHNCLVHTINEINSGYCTSRCQFRYH